MKATMITEKRINFYDCDPAGILFFANIFKLAHSAYEEMMEKLNLSIDFFNDDKYVLPILNSEAKFVSPIKAGDKIEIEIKVSQLKKSSFELSYIFTKKDKILAEAKTVHVCVDKITFSKIALPDELYQSLESNRN